MVTSSSRDINHAAFGLALWDLSLAGVPPAPISPNAGSELPTVVTQRLAPRRLFSELIDIDPVSVTSMVVDQTNHGSEGRTTLRVSVCRKRHRQYQCNIDNTLPPHKPSNVGICNVMCEHCHTMRWKGEINAMCCRNGAVVLPP